MTGRERELDGFRPVGVYDSVEDGHAGTGGRTVALGLKDAKGCWSGGLDHYSWMYFGPGDFDGTLSILDATCTSCTSYFGCVGTDGEFAATASLRAVMLTMPSSCGETGHTIWEVTEVCPPDGYPPGSSADVTLLGPTESLRCNRYSLDQCDPTLASCPVPGW